MTCIVLIITLASAAGCLDSKIPPVKPPNAPAVLVDYYRSGGIAGFDDRLVIFDNGVAIVSGRTLNQEIELNTTDLDRLVRLFSQSQFSMLEGSYSARPGSADIMRYTISYQNKTVSAEDSAVPLTLQPVIDELNRILTLPAVTKQNAGLTANLPR